MIWIILDSLGYPIRAFTDEAKARKVFANYHPEFRLIRMIPE